MKKTDFHVHSTASDGFFSPEELIDLAEKNNVKIFSITDHDSVDSVERAIRYSKGKDIKIVSGIEISCGEPELSFFNIHILGFFINHKSKKLVRFLEDKKRSRLQRTISKIKNSFPEISIIKLRNKIKKAIGKNSFERFSAIKSSFQRTKPDIKEAVNIIKSAGGIPILAHPGIYFNKMDKIITKFIDSKGRGVEIYYPYDKIYSFNAKTKKSLINKLKAIAKKHNLLISGGTDFHGPNRLVEMGECSLNSKDVEKLIRHEG